MAERYFRKLTLLLLCSFCFTAHGDEEDNLPTYEYMQIFQSIPALFEYLLDVVEQRPEVLETDDIGVFSRYQDEGTEIREKRSNGANNKNDNEEIRADVTHSENEKGVVDADGYDSSDKSSDIIIENNNEDPSKSSVDKEDIKHRSSTDAGRIDISRVNEVNQFAEPSGISGVDENLIMHWDEAFIGFDTLFSLDYQPEDVVKQIIRIEELLEEHNNKKDK